MINKIKNTYRILENNEKRKVFFIFCFMLISSGLEVIGIGLILPVLNIIIQNDISFIDKYFYFFSDFFDTTDKSNVVVFLIVLIILANLLKTLTLTFTNIKSAQYIAKIQIRITEDIFKKYLNSDWSFLNKKNTATLLRNIHANTVDFTERILRSYIWIFSDLTIVLLITIMLMFISFKISLTAFSILALFGSISHIVLKNKNLKYGEQRNLNLKLINKHIIETFRNIKLIRILNKENFFQKNFKILITNENRPRVKQQILGKLPTIWIEFLIIFLIFSVAIVFEKFFSGIYNFIPMAGVLLAAFYKLLPGLNRIIIQLQYIKFCEPIFKNLLKEYRYFDSITEEKNLLQKKDPINFEKNFIIKNLYFKYDNNLPNIFEKLNLTFDKNQTYGLIGKSGSGKSTLIDLITGILKPTNGDIFVDGKSIYKNLKDWQKCFGYVPQETYLSDNTIKKNIAFGVEDKDINTTKIREILKKLDLEELIKSLPNGIETFVGDFGSRLSGGQKQRIGIARALYFNPSILLLDESTSSLDLNSEEKILSLVEKIKKHITILIISHRKTALSICDKIVDLNNIKKI